MCHRYTGAVLLGEVRQCNEYPKAEEQEKSALRLRYRTMHFLTRSAVNYLEISLQKHGYIKFVGG